MDSTHCRAGCNRSIPTAQRASRLKCHDMMGGGICTPAIPVPWVVRLACLGSRPPARLRVFRRGPSRVASMPRITSSANSPLTHAARRSLPSHDESSSRCRPDHRRVAGQGVHLQAVQAADGEAVWHSTTTTSVPRPRPRETPASATIQDEPTGCAGRWPTTGPRGPAHRRPVSAAENTGNVIAGLADRIGRRGRAGRDRPPRARIGPHAGSRCPHAARRAGPRRGSSRGPQPDLASAQHMTFLPGRPR